MCLRPCGSFETLKVKLKQEIVYAVLILSDGIFFTYIHIDFKQADCSAQVRFFFIPSQFPVSQNGLMHTCQHA